MHLQPYLMFPGTCRRALEFYADVFGGAIAHLQTVGDSPLPAAPEHADRVFNSIFTAGDLRFMASDGEPGKDPTVGQNVAMFVTCADVDEQRRVFEALARGGHIIMPLGTGLGMVADPFGIQWMVVCQQ